MSVDRPQPTWSVQGSQRTTFLDVLRLELLGGHDLSSDLVACAHGAVLRVFGPGEASVEIGCEMTPDGWWFTWAADDARTIAPVEDLQGTAKLVARDLRDTA